MKQSCIQHPPNDRIVLIRQSYVDLCDGNHCAAALLNFFEYWHNIRLEQSEKSREQNIIAERHGESGVQDTSLYQFHNEADLARGLCAAYGETSIRKAVKLLEKKGFISIHKNPNPRYAFDATRHILLHPDCIKSVASIVSKPHNGDVKMIQRCRENTATSPEISSMITSEISPKETSKEVSLGIPRTKSSKKSRATPPDSPQTSRVVADNNVVVVDNDWGSRPQRPEGFSFKDSHFKGLRSSEVSTNIETSEVPHALSPTKFRATPPEPPAASRVWDAYAHAYRDRYGTPPVRNAKVNAQLKQFVQRVPQDEAAHIAAFYVWHSSAYYQTRGHPIGLLLSDAEKLRTEWKTNRPILAPHARQQEKTANNPFLPILDRLQKEAEDDER